MTQRIINTEYTQSNGLHVVLQQLAEASETELVEQIYALSDRPEVLGLLIYKLMLEKKKTNELLKNLDAKYNRILLLLKTLERERAQNARNKIVLDETNIDNLFLTEQDKTILKLAKGKYLTAKEVQEYIGYKGLNAASQRLNKLEKEGYLKKRRVGQQVVFGLADNYI